jgi:hypothetical protein
MPTAVGMRILRVPAKYGPNVLLCIPPVAPTGMSLFPLQNCPKHSLEACCQAGSMQGGGEARLCTEVHATGHRMHGKSEQTDAAPKHQGKAALPHHWKKDAVFDYQIGDNCTIGFTIPLTGLETYVLPPNEVPMPYCAF